MIMKASRSLLRVGIVGFAGTVAVLATIWLLLPKPPLLDGVDFSSRVRDRDGGTLRVTLTRDQKYRIRSSLNETSPALVDATLQFEDKYFARHPGVNPIALLRSTCSLAGSGRARAGASTITMQLARLRFHLHTRTLRGKAEQILRAVEL